MWNVVNGIGEDAGKAYRALWALGDPVWPKTATAFGGKFGIDDDTETPNTLSAVTAVRAFST